MKLSFFILCLLSGSVLYAGNVALSEKSMVPVGERIANYLQAVMVPAGAAVDAKNPGDVFNPRDPYRLSFNYDPEGQVIDVYLTGGSDNIDEIKNRFVLTQELILKLNRKIEKYYGVTLKAEDLSMDYLNVKTGKIMLKWVDGQYIDKSQPSPVPQVTPTP